MTDRLKHILIGIFLIAALSLGAGMLLFLKPTVGDGRQVLQVRFANIAGIVVGTRVTFAGKPVGEVVSIEEVKDARTMPLDDTGRVYPYQLTLRLDSGIDVYDTDEIAIRTTGLMGEKSVGILPKAVPHSRLVRVEEILYASSIDPLENTFNQMSRVANRAEEAVSHLDLWFEKNSEALTQTLHAFQGACLRVDDTIGHLQEEQLIPRLTTLATSLHHTLDTFCDESSLALHSIHRFTEDAASGTLGKLLCNEDAYLRVSSLMSKAETLMNDINHYGLLFQYDKHWQRSRTKRANLLKSLDSPRDFRLYFETEMDAITTSLGRLTELLDRTDQVATNPDFKRHFAILLRNAQSLTDGLKLYNQELTNRIEGPDSEPQ